MTVRTLVTFYTDIPDDAIETADGMDFIQWPGRVMVQAMADLLRGLGWQPDEPLDLEERGWDLDASRGSEMISLRIEWPEEVVVQITDRTPDYTWYFKRKPPGPVFLGILVGLDAALKADGRFRDIQWFTPKGYLKEPGMPFPVDVAP
jgi:hypothetical protein